ncbi:unnamed protein product [Brachionus calyciflorus]|uniref:Nuclear receptor n=1 Tax=Brachionus calyciflorus TaxID=104777 RepID=A0A814EXW6_9BILA|nr:unnamed protein product [Brachionus calyciflorus]
MQFEISDWDHERRKLEQATLREINLSIKRAECDTDSTRFEFGPCKICSDEATGIHYGAPTCEPCKGFFKRSLLRHIGYVCRDKNFSCKIYPKKTKKCQLCRWNACLKAGMSVNGIRMGRIPNSMKISKNKDQTYQSLAKNESSDIDKENSLLKQLIKLNDLNCFKRREAQNYLPNTFLSEKILNKSKESQIIVLSMLRDKSSQLFIEHTCEYESHEKRGLEIIKSGKRLTRFYSEEFIFLVRQKILSLLEKHAVILYKILYDLPGFQRFSQSDLKKILPCYFFVLYGLRTIRLFIDEDYFLFLDGDILIDKELYTKVMGHEITEMVFDFYQSLKELNLTNEEYGLLFALLISSQKDSNLDDSNLLKEINEYYVQALNYEFNINKRNIEFVNSFLKRNKMQCEISDCDDERTKFKEKISRELYLSIKKAQNDNNSIRFEFGACKVCSDEATGIHYGAPTCEPCKGFFKRSLLRHKSYVCRENKLSCKIYPKKTKKCQLCRWNACLQAGMSVNGIRIGRIPNSMKTTKRIDQTNQSLVKNVSCDIDKENSLLKQLIKLNDLNCFKRREAQNYLPNTFLSEKILNKSKESQIIVLSMLRDKSSQLFIEHTCEYESHEKRGLEMIHSGKETSRFYTEEFIDLVRKKMLDVLEKHAGILHKILCDLPGFQRLSQADLKRILTCQFFVLYGLRTIKLFMNDDYFLFLDGDILLDRKLFTIVMGQEVSDLVFDFYQSMRVLNLTNQEYGLLVPLFFSSQNSNLDDSNLLKEINEYYIQALSYQFNLNKRNIEFVNNFLKVISKAPIVNKKIESVDFFFDSNKL